MFELNLTIHGKTVEDVKKALSKIHMDQDVLLIDKQNAVYFGKPINVDFDYYLTVDELKANGESLHVSSTTSTSTE